MILRKFSPTETANQSLMKTEKNDLNKITKYIIRQTQSEDDAIELEKLSFAEFLSRLGLNYEKINFGVEMCCETKFSFLAQKRLF